MGRQIDRHAIAALSAGHFATDFSNGALPALLPFFVQRFDLSYTQVGELGLRVALASSIIQPLFGLWSDRRGAVWLLPVGVALAGAGMALAAVAESSYVCLLFVTVSGLGTAAYHPEGSEFRPTSAGTGGRVGCRCSRLAGTSASPSARSRRRRSCCSSAGRAVSCSLVPAAVAVFSFASMPYLGGFAPERGNEHAFSGEDRPGALALLLA